MSQQDRAPVLWKYFVSSLSIIIPLFLIYFFPAVEGFFYCNESWLLFWFICFVVVFPLFFLGFLIRGTHAVQTKDITIPLFMRKKIKLTGFKAQLFGILLILLVFIVIPYLYIKIGPHVFVQGCPPVDLLRRFW